MATMIMYLHVHTMNLIMSAMLLRIACISQSIRLP
jgi:hypothetical protein